MKKLTLAAAVLFALGYASQASAGGYAGSSFQKSDCTYSKPSNTLVCSMLFTTTSQSTGMAFVNDPTCVGSETRVFQRTETLVQTWRRTSWFTGHVPLAKNEVAGDEGLVSETRTFTDVDLGCLV